MWRRRAAAWAVVVVGIVLLAACAGWAVLADRQGPTACELPTPPPHSGPLECGP